MEITHRERIALRLAERNSEVLSPCMWEESVWSPSVHFTTSTWNFLRKCWMGNNPKPLTNHPYTNHPNPSTNHPHTNHLKPLTNHPHTNHPNPHTNHPIPTIHLPITQPTYQSSTYQSPQPIYQVPLCHQCLITHSYRRAMCGGVMGFLFATNVL